MEKFRTLKKCRTLTECGVPEKAVKMNSEGSDRLEAA